MSEMAEIMESKRLALVRLIVDWGFRVGRFTLASGAESNFYVDVRMVATHPEGAALIGDLLIDRMLRLHPKPVAVGGLALGAVPVAMAVTARSVQAGFPLASFIARKDAKTHGTGRKMEGHLRDGDAVVVLDDTVTTGASTLQAIDAVRETCPTARIVQVMSVVDRQEGGREKIEAAGWTLNALVTRDDLFRLYEGR